MGWADPTTPVELLLESFTPAKILPGVLWELEIEKLKQHVLDKKNEYNINSVNTVQSPETIQNSCTSMVVKIIDKGSMD